MIKLPPTGSGSGTTHRLFRRATVSGAAGVGREAGIVSEYQFTLSRIVE
jgi:hypothetical protein